MTDTTTDTTLGADPPPLPAAERNATVAVYGDLQHAEDGVRALETAGYDMTKLSIVARGEYTERHVMGFQTRQGREGQWARWGAVWGVLFGAFFLVPGVGNVAFGGYLLYAILTGAFGAGMGAVLAAMQSVGIPDDAIIRYETAIKADKQLVVAHGVPSDIEFARNVLSETAAESIEMHLSSAEVPA